MKALKGIIKQLNDAISNKSTETIESLEKIASENLSDFSQIPLFYSLPLQNILHIVEISELSDEADYLELLSVIAKNIDEKYPKESALLLHSIQPKNLQFTLNSIVKIISQLSHCPLCSLLGRLYEEEQTQVTVDYEYQYKQAKKKIKSLKKQMTKYGLLNPHFHPITSKPSDYESDIFKAVQSNKLDSIRWLIEQEKVDVNLANSKQETLLNIASQYGHLNIVQYLCKKGADPNIPSSPSSNGWQPIHWATEYGHFDIVRYLVEEVDANIHAKRADNYNLLHIACTFQNLGLVKYLCEHGCESDINDKTLSSLTPLHITCIRCNNPLVTLYLIEHGADINIKFRNYTPLQLAKTYKSTSIAELLESYGAT